MASYRDEGELRPSATDKCPTARPSAAKPHPFLSGFLSCPVGARFVCHGPRWFCWVFLCRVGAGSLAHHGPRWFRWVLLCRVAAGSPATRHTGLLSSLCPVAVGSPTTRHTDLLSSPLSGGCRFVRRASCWFRWVHLVRWLPFAGRVGHHATLVLLGAGFGVADGGSSRRAPIPLVRGRVVRRARFASTANPTAPPLSTASPLFLGPRRVVRTGPLLAYAWSSAFLLPHHPSR